MAWMLAFHGLRHAGDRRDWTWVRLASHQLLANEGLNARLVVKVHAGSAVTGQFGAPGDLRYDVIGHDVMVAAKLEARTVAVSAAAFRALQPATRQKLKRHTPGVVYIPVDDPRP